MKFWGITEVKLYLKDNKVEKINCDIFNNNEETKEDDKKDDSNDSISSSKKSNNNSSEDEELKQFKMNLNLNKEELQSGNISESKKNNEKDKHNDKYNDKYKDKNNDKYNETNANTTKKSTVIKLKRASDSSSSKKMKSPKKKNTIEIDNKNDEKNNQSNKKGDEEIFYNNTINSKYKGNSKFPNIKINNTMKNEEDVTFNKNEKSEYKPQVKKKNLIRNLISSFSGENIEKDIFNHERKLGKEYPLIFGTNAQSKEKIIESMEKDIKEINDFIDIIIDRVIKLLSE